MLQRPFPRLITVLGLLAISLGATTESCSLRDALGGGGNGDNPDFVSQLQLKNANADTTDTFDQGDDITLVLSVRNRLSTGATVEFASARISDFVVVRENSSTVVWKWSTAQPPFTPNATKLEFSAGETKTFDEVWNQVGDNGVQVPAGTYEARGVLFYDGFDVDPLKTNQLGSTLVKFTIR